MGTRRAELHGEWTGARFTLNFISAVSPRGELRFAFCPGALTTAKFIDFLKRLMIHRDTAVFLVIKGQLRLFQLPPHSPDLSPDELAWNHLKRRKLGCLALSGSGHLKRHAMAFLRALQKRPAIVRGLLQHPTVRYTV